MALIALEEALAIAEKRGCAIPAFNVYNMETVKGVMRAAEKLRAPVIFQAYYRMFDSDDAPLLCALILRAAEMMNAPAVLHLDHGATLTQVVRAIRLGATSAMYDGSAHPLAENIRQTREVVSLCHAANVPVEGELGHVGLTEDDSLDAFTVPEEAARFAKETGVSALAVQVGTAHGRYAQPPKLDIARLREIREAAKIPLVLHGGSGVPDSQIQDAVRAGVRKVNFGTDLCYAFLDAARSGPADQPAVDLYMRPPVEAAAAYAETKIRLLGACG